MWERQEMSQKITPWSAYRAINVEGNKPSIYSEATADKIWVLLHMQISYRKGEGGIKKGDI